MAGEEHDRAVGRPDDVRGGLDAVAVRQADGEDRRVGAGALDQRKGVRAPQRLADDFAAGGPDRAAERRAGALVVVENRHAPARTSSHALCVSQAECQTSATSKISHLGRDRKSTRLNSSHLVISYAVFCLKKKKKTKTEADIKHLKANVSSGCGAARPR